jgi:hypothetical protein
MVAICGKKHDLRSIALRKTGHSAGRGEPYRHEPRPQLCPTFEVEVWLDQHLCGYVKVYDRTISSETRCCGHHKA